MAGVELPVRPRKRHVYHLEAAVSLGAAPLTIDPSGIYFRPEGPAYIAGFSPRAGEPDPDTLDLGRRPRAGSRAFVWPALAHRVPAFDRVRLLDTWAGHYEVNTLDANAIIGPHPDIRNLLFANGFSGHGLQQAPAVGRGLAEWIDHRPLREPGPWRPSGSIASSAGIRSRSSTSSDGTGMASVTCSPADRGASGPRERARRGPPAGHAASERPRP